MGRAPQEHDYLLKPVLQRRRRSRVVEAVHKRRIRGDGAIELVPRDIQLPRAVVGEPVRIVDLGLDAVERAAPGGRWKWTSPTFAGGTRERGSAVRPEPR